MLGGLASHLERKYPKVVTTYIGLALAMAVFFAPVWGEFALGSSAANMRLWFPAWRP